MYNCITIHNVIINYMYIKQNPIYPTYICSVLINDAMKCNEWEE